MAKISFNFPSFSTDWHEKNEGMVGISTIFCRFPARITSDRRQNAGLWPFATEAGDTHDRHCREVSQAALASPRYGSGIYILLITAVTVKVDRREK